jgi:hypothetical protein
MKCVLGKMPVQALDLPISMRQPLALLPMNERPVPANDCRAAAPQASGRHAPMPEFLIALPDAEGFRC